MDHPSVKITTNGSCGHVYVNGMEIEGCVSYDIHHEVAALPKVTITMLAQKLEIEHGSADYREKRERTKWCRFKEFWKKAWKKFKLWMFIKWHVWRQGK